jgi:hypothetical protein
VKAEGWGGGGGGGAFSTKLCRTLSAMFLPDNAILLLLLTAIELSLGGSTDKTSKNTYINETLQKT